MDDNKMQQLIQKEKERLLNNNNQDKIHDFVKSVTDINKFYEANKDVLELVDQWSDITGLSLDEINKLELPEIIELVREKANLKGDIELLKSVLPKNYIMPNNKLAQKITDDVIKYNKANSLLVNKQKNIISMVELNYDDKNIQITETDKKFTAYDRAVHNAICSIYEAGNRLFTPDQVYRCMNGLDDQQYVSPQAVGAITKSIDKSRRIHVKVDCTKEAQAYNKKAEKMIMDGYILAATRINVKAGGKEVTGYELNNKPILYRYAQMTKQIITVPSKLLNTKDVIKSTPDVIVIREYLIRRIEGMKNEKNNLKNQIAFEKVYIELDQPNPIKQKAQKIRETIDILLKKFKNEKYIKGHEFYKEGKSFKGVKIFY